MNRKSAHIKHPSFAALVSKSHTFSILNKALIVFLPLLGIANAKALNEYFTDGLERHTFDFRVAEENENPADKADGAVEAEGAGRGDPFHHREESGSDKNIRGPASHGVLVALSINGR